MRVSSGPSKICQRICRRPSTECSRSWSGQQLPIQLCKKVFELVAAAQRPLAMEELRHAVSVVPGDATWDMRKLINDVQRVVDCCGSFILVDEEYLTIHFIHHSIKQYLLSDFKDTSVRRYHVDSIEADLRLGEICVTYLSLDVPDMQLEAVRTDPQTQSKQGPQIQPKSIASAILDTALPQSMLCKKNCLETTEVHGRFCS